MQDEDKIIGIKDTFYRKVSSMLSSLLETPEVFMPSVYESAKENSVDVDTTPVDRIKFAAENTYEFEDVDIRQPYTISKHDLKKITAISKQLSREEKYAKKYGVARMKQAAKLIEDSSMVQQFIVDFCKKHPGFASSKGIDQNNIMRQELLREFRASNLCRTLREQCQKGVDKEIDKYTLYFNK